MRARDQWNPVVCIKADTLYSVLVTLIAQLFRLMSLQSHMAVHEARSSAGSEVKGWAAHPIVLPTHSKSIPARLAHGVLSCHVDIILIMHWFTLIQWWTTARDRLFHKGWKVEFSSAKGIDTKMLNPNEASYSSLSSCAGWSIIILPIQAQLFHLFCLIPSFRFPLIVHSLQLIPYQNTSISLQFQIFLKHLLTLPPATVFRPLLLPNIYSVSTLFLHPSSTFTHLSSSPWQVSALLAKCWGKLQHTNLVWSQQPSDVLCVISPTETLKDINMVMAASPEEAIRSAGILPGFCGRSGKVRGSTREIRDKKLGIIWKSVESGGGKLAFMVLFRFLKRQWSRMEYFYFIGKQSAAG